MKGVMDHTSIGFNLEAPRVLYITSVAILRSDYDGRGGAWRRRRSGANEYLDALFGESRVMVVSHNVAPMLFDMVPKGRSSATCILYVQYIENIAVVPTCAVRGACFITPVTAVALSIGFPTLCPIRTAGQQCAP